MIGLRSLSVRWIVAALLALFPMMPLNASAAGKTVRVGAYYFPPFVAETTGPPTGISADLAALFNRSQKEFKFVLVRTTPGGRYADFDRGNFDSLYFEEIAWGWAGRPVGASASYLVGGEVYVARVEPGRTQEYFSDIAKRRIAAMEGYHYGFAEFNADPAQLVRRFDIWLGASHVENLERVLDGRADIAVVSLSFLRRQLATHSDWQKKLLISDKFDQRYAFTIVVRDGTHPTPAWFDRMFAMLRKSKALDALWTRYGLMQQLPEQPAQ